MTNQLNLVIEPVNKYLEQVTALITQECRTVNSDYLQELLEYIFQMHGKLLRPALVFSTAAISNNEPDQQAIWIAAGLEILHTASLVHDDIIDGGTLRRGQRTIHTQFGVGEATLLGDWLLAKSFELMTRTENSKIIHGMTMLTSELTEGQFLEMEAQRGRPYDESNYMRMIDLKTASIFRYACQFACLCVPDIRHKANQMLSFGTNFGIMFQIIDDLIDLYQKDEKALKSTGVDLLNGLITLPIFRALDFEKNKSIKPLHEALTNRNLDFIQHELPNYLKTSGVVRDCLTVAQKYADCSLEYLQGSSKGEQILTQLVEFTMDQVNQFDNIPEAIEVSF